jgi:hypothetical protein
VLIETLASAYVNEDGQVVLEMRRPTLLPGEEPSRKTLTRAESRAFALSILHIQGAQGMAAAKEFVAGLVTFSPATETKQTSESEQPLEGGTYRTPPNVIPMFKKDR